jgi:predicted nucleotidyltransferase
MFGLSRALRILILFALLFSFASAPAAPSCMDLFKNDLIVSFPSSHLDPLSAIYETLESGRGDAVRIIHESFITISKNPALIKHLPLLLADLKKLQVSSDSFLGINETYLKQAIVLARLAQGDMETWKGLLTAPEAALAEFHEFNTFGTMGYLLKSLPENKKNELLAYLGEVYDKKKNRSLIQPVHVLLDPKAIYDEFKKAGRSDREFYIHYLQLIHEKVFKNKVTGGYSADLVIEIANLIQQSKLQDGQQEVNFFGSVVNGFGKPESDLDIFDSHYEAFWPENVKEEMENEGDLRHVDLFNIRRRPLVDPDLELEVSKLLKGTPWHWRSEDYKSHNVTVEAHEHIGGESHVFSFHISKNKIVLRFYPDLIHWDEKAEKLPPWRYIELDVTQ